MAITARMIEEIEHLIPTKHPTRYTQNIASDSQAQLLAFMWQNHLEQTGEWAKRQKLAPLNQCSIALLAVILGEGKSLIPKQAQMGLLSCGREPV